MEVTLLALTFQCVGIVGIGLCLIGIEMFGG